MNTIERLARPQLGLVTTGQLLASGVGGRQIEHWIRTGRLLRMRRGVLRAAGAPVTREQAWLAAVLAAGDGVVLSHACAAMTWGFRGFDVDDGIDLLALGERPRLDGVRGHSTIWLPESDRTVRHRIPVTTAERTLIDACGLVSFGQLERATDDALRRDLLSLSRLARCFEQIPVSGRRKSLPIRELLAERVPGYDPGGSNQELDILKVLRQAGIHPQPVQQHRVVVEGQTYVLDYAWPDTMHALEYYGERFHDTVSAFHGDRARTRRLQRAGWTVWEVTRRTSETEIVAIGHRATAPFRQKSAS